MVNDDRSVNSLVNVGLRALGGSDVRMTNHDYFTMRMQDQKNSLRDRGNLKDSMILIDVGLPDALTASLGSV
jgi:hypothetical protein